MSAASASAPDIQLTLEHVHGYNGSESGALSPNLHLDASGRMVYFTAAVCVVAEYVASEGGVAVTSEQRFFTGHDDDVQCLALDESRTMGIKLQNGLDGTEFMKYYMCLASASLVAGCFSKG